MTVGAPDGESVSPAAHPTTEVAAGPARTASRADPVTVAIIAALADRAAALQGEARLWLTRRVEALTAEQASATPRGTAAERAAEKAADETAARRRSLAGLSDLVDRLGRSPASPAPPAIQPRPDPQRRAGLPAVASPAPAPEAPPASLRAVTAFKSTWSRLRAEQRLRQALAQVPAMAGPLNSAQVVAQALLAMRELSPPYLNACMAHIDTLCWLDHAAGPGDLAPRSVTTAAGRRRPSGRTARPT